MIRSYGSWLVQSGAGPEGTDRRDIPPGYRRPAHQRVLPDGNKRATRLYLALSVLVLVLGDTYEWNFTSTPSFVSVAPPARDQHRRPPPGPVADAGAPAATGVP
jgi:hypothetical protein